MNLSNGTLAVTLDSVSSSGSNNNGIRITDTDGSFTVAGTSAGAQDGSGGSIANSTGPGIEVLRATNISLSSMNLDDTGASGILLGGLGANGVTNASLTGLSVDNCGNAVNENNVEMINVTGDISITGSRFTEGAEHNVIIENQTGTITSLTVTINEFDNAASSAAFGHGLRIETLSSGAGNAQITNSTISYNTIHDNASTGIFIVNNGSGTITSAANDNVLLNNNIHVDLSVGTQGGNKDGIITKNVMTTSNSHGVNLFHATGAGAASGFFNAEVTENNITAVGDVVGSLGGNGIRSSKGDQVDAALLIDDNIIRVVSQNFFGGRGIEVSSSGAGTTDVHVTNNDVDLAADFNDAFLEALALISQTGHTVTTDITGNTLVGDFGGGFPITVSVQSNGATLRVEDQGAGSPNVAHEIDTTNTVTGGAAAVQSFGGTQTLVAAGTTQNP